MYQRAREGWFERGRVTESVQFLYIARGSGYRGEKFARPERLAGRDTWFRDFCDGTGSGRPIMARTVRQGGALETLRTFAPVSWMASALIPSERPFVPPGVLGLCATCTADRSGELEYVNSCLTRSCHARG